MPSGNINQNYANEQHTTKNENDSFLSNSGLNSKLSNIKTRTLDMFSKLMSTVNNNSSK